MSSVAIDDNVRLFLDGFGTDKDGVEKANDGNSDVDGDGDGEGEDDAAFNSILLYVNCALQDRGELADPSF